MTSPIATILKCTSAICAFAVFVPAFAQNTAQGEQSGASAGNGLEEIVVTARRVEERVQSVPIAITALSQGDMDRLQITQARDLVHVVPSLSTAPQLADPNAPYSGFFRLRGLAGTVIYFNDVPIGSTDFDPATGNIHSLSPGFFYDLDNLEVLKGPQGTLFGKNSIGGLVSLEPKHPTNAFEGYGKITLGDYNDREFEGAINVPIIKDKLLVRVAGQTQQRDGYTANLVNGKDYDNVDYYTWRVGVTLRPTDDFENYFLYDGYYQHTNGTATITRYVNPSFVFTGLNASFNPVPLSSPTCAYTLALGGPAFAPGTPPGGCGAATIGLFPTVSSQLVKQQQAGARALVGQSIPGLGKDYFYGLTDVATWNVSDSLTIKNIAAARIFKQFTNIDYVSLGLPIINIGAPPEIQTWGNNEVQYTEELQFQGKALNDKLTWILGGFLEFDHPLGDSVFLTTAVGAGTYYHYHNSTRSQAVFAHGIYDLSDWVEGLRFTAGYRYTWDYSSVQELATNGVDRVIRGPSGTPTNCGTPVNFDNNCFIGSNAHFSSYGWNLALDYQVDPSTLVYVRSGNAYRPGGTNPQVELEFQDLKPEHVTDVELGVKSDWDLSGVQARTNAAIFHTDYKAIQVTQLVQVVDSTGATHANYEELNAASATLEGAELEATFVPLKGVEIAPHASYIFASYDEYPTAFGATTNSKPPLFYLPKWQYGATGTYHLPVDESWGDIAVSLSYSWIGHQYFSVTAGEPRTIVPSYENFDLKVDWTNVFQQPIDLGAFVSNLTDNTHITGIQPLYTSLGISSAAYNPPRMFGFSLKYRFGPEKDVGEPATAYTPPPVVAPAIARSYMVFFDFNTSDLTPQAVQIVDQAARNAGPAKVTEVTVTGHTDTVGSDAYNMRLSRRRAESVAAELEKQGIPASEIQIVAKGKRDLLVPTGDGVREPQNRRVHIVYDGGPGA
jgi:iron complex outermembrane receptor protein